MVTPTGRHAEVGVAALRAGKHVITTKPMEASVAGCDALIDAARAALFEARETRVRPGRDDKILTAWNGLMIRGMAIAATFAGSRCSTRMNRARPSGVANRSVNSRGVPGWSPAGHGQNTPSSASTRG